MNHFTRIFLFRSLPALTMILLLFAACDRDPVELDEPTPVSGTLSAATTWTNRISDPAIPDYLVSGELRVTAALTIEAGVTVAFASDAVLDITGGSGILIAVGEAGSPITFTGESATKGFWRGIRIHTPDIRNEMTYCVVEYAGSQELGYAVPKAAIALVDFAGDEGRLKLSNTLIRQTAGYGVAVQDDAVFQAFSNNQIQFNDLPAIHMKANNMGRLDAVSILEGGVDVKSSDLEVATETTWPALAGGEAYHLLGDLRINSGLRIAAGATFIFEPDKLIEINPDAYLIAVGEATKLITFKGVSDGTASWRGININSADVRNEMRYCLVRDAGIDQVIYSSDAANIVLSDYIGTRGRLKLSFSTVQGSAGCGVFVDSGCELTESDNTFADNAVGTICN
ncbi:MAG: hypothetical protein OHK0039_19440 [Bacteroidia bacterium]